VHTGSSAWLSHLTRPRDRNVAAVETNVKTFIVLSECDDIMTDLIKCCTFFRIPVQGRFQASVGPDAVPKMRPLLPDGFKNLVLPC